MARVFVSYRRADGHLGVDWLAERLEKLDEVNGVQAAFHDGGLKAGESFADALEAELADADVIVAFIGPNWEGRSETGPSRITEDDDWVVREIARAFELEKKVIPVILEGAEQPRASDLHPSIAQLPENHSLPMRRAVEVDNVVKHIVEHLATIDKARAKKAGLEERVVVPNLTNPAKLVALCLLGAVIGHLLALASGWWLSEQPRPPTLRETNGWSWYRWLLLHTGTYLGAIIPVGYLMSRRIVRTSVVQWKSLITAALVVTGVPALLSGNRTNSLMILVLDDPSNISFRYLRSIGGILFISLAVVAWIVPLGAAVYSSPRAKPHELGERATTLAIVRDSERWGVMILSLIIATSTAVNLALAVAGDQGNLADFEFDERSLISIPLILTALVVIVHRWATTRLDDADAALRHDLKQLPASYRENATPKTAIAPFADGGWGFRIAVASPVTVAVLGVAIHALG